MSLPQDVTVFLEQYIQNIQGLIRSSVEDHLVGVHPRSFKMKVETWTHRDSFGEEIRIACMLHQDNCRTASFKQFEFDGLDHHLPIRDVIIGRFGEPDMTAAEMLGSIMSTPDFKELHERIEMSKHAGSKAGKKFFDAFSRRSIFKQLVED